MDRRLILDDSKLENCLEPRRIETGSHATLEATTVVVVVVHQLIHVQKKFSPTAVTC